MKRHGSAMPIPGSKAKRNRQRGGMSSAMNRAFEDDWKSAKRIKMRDMKVDAPFNAWNSFISSWSKDHLVGELYLTLKSMPNMDVTIHETDYMIRGRKYIEHTCCEFQIELFGTTTHHSQYPNHILVEFQRRNGDGFVFQAFISEVMTSMNPDAITHSKFNRYDTASHDLRHFVDDDDEPEERKSIVVPQTQETQLQTDVHQPRHVESIDRHTLKRLLDCLFNGDGHSKRTASSYLANHIQGNERLMQDILTLEPYIITKLSDLLLKCVDPEIVRSIGCTLYYMLQESNDLRHEAQKLNLKRVFMKVSQRWKQPIETRFGSKKHSKSSNVVNVLPSSQAAQKMMSCVSVLE